MLGNLTRIVARGECAGRFEQHQCRTVVRDRAVFGAPGDDEDVVSSESDTALGSARLAQMDVERSVEHEEQLVGIAVRVPDILATHFDESNVPVVGPGEDTRIPQIVEGGENSVDIRGRRLHRLMLTFAHPSSTVR